MRFRLDVLPLQAFVIAMLASRVVNAQQNALSASATASDSTSSSRRGVGARSDDPKDPRRDAAERPRTTVAAVRVSGKPGSLEVVGVPVPRTFADGQDIRYRIVPVAGVRIIGRTEGFLSAAHGRPASIIVSVSVP